MAHASRLLLLALAMMSSSASFAADAARDAMAFFEAGQFDKAAALFADPAWRGVALYRSGRYRMAIEAFREAGDPESLYNLGNAYARLTEYGDALKAYDQALAARPELEDARANRELIRVLIEAQKKEREPSGAGAQSQTVATRSESNRSKDDAADLDQDSLGEVGRAGATPSGELSQQPGTAIPPGLQDLPQPNMPRERDKIAGVAADTGGLGAEDSGQAPPPLEMQQALTTKPKVPSFEDKQASIEWLSAIHDDTERFLRMRLMHELSAREAAGTAVPAGADPW